MNPRASVLDAAAVQRFARHIALPEIGPDGQQRLIAARVVVAGGDGAAETAARYLAAAGVGALRLVAAGDGARWDDDLRGSNPKVVVEHHGWPRDGAEWVAVLEGADLVVRSGFDDDAMLRAALRHGIPAVVFRGRYESVDLIAFRHQGPCPHAPLDVPAQASTPPQSGYGDGDGDGDGATAIVAGTLAATEALHLLLGNGGTARARHLRLPLGGLPPLTQEIPWSPECFACGGSGTEMSFS
jgi:adenylyltransferase/sulfurtransferase